MHIVATEFHMANTQLNKGFHLNRKSLNLFNHAKAYQFIYVTIVILGRSIDRFLKQRREPFNNA